MKRSTAISLPNTTQFIIFAALAVSSLTGCELVKGIFKAGVWVGVLAVFAVIGLIVFGISKLRS
ncbi:MAG: hypothetical protein ACM3ZE_20770 [Myxococcales bacterium]